MSTTCCTTQRLNLIIMGLPGSGKGTQSDKIAKRYDLKHITTGQLLREEAEKDTKTAREINRLMKTGELFPDELVNSVLTESMPRSNFLLDGYPRTLTQVDVVKDIDLVIYIDLPEEEAIRRILNRNEGRPDDNEKTVKIRLDAFNTETIPVIEYYKKKGILEIVDGMGSEESIFNRITEVIFRRFNI